jgi:MoaA/NifB/PqqE/SkfB family radical SAM enzyme
MSGGFSTENFADEQGNKNPRRFIPTAKALEILDDCAAVGVKAIEFTGGGEPTVHPDHRLIIARAQALGLETGLVTNGVLLRDDPCFHALDWLRISLDAGKAETYQNIRASKAWPKVMGNLRLAAGLVKPYTGVGFVVTRENWSEIGAACLIAKNAGIKYVRLSAMFSAEAASYYDGLLPSIREERQRAQLFNDVDFKVIDLFGDRIENLDQGAPDYDFCGKQQFVLYVGGDQKIYTCCTNAYTTAGEIGDLRQQRFADWLKGHRRFDFNARGCHHCQFSQTNRNINFLLEKDPTHVNFV